jgi:hypothetical protein
MIANDNARPADPQKPRPDSTPRATDNEPTDGPEAQKRREKMQKQEKAEGERR